MKDVYVTERFASFWGSIFSNWADAVFKADGITWSNSEQYFMWLKAKHFNDDEIADLILKTPNPEEAKKLGRKIRNFDNDEWLKVCFEKMHKAVYAKFSQIEEYKNALLSEEFDCKHFVEGSPFDKLWGVGIIWNSPEIADEHNWTGKNFLGKVLDVVREELR